MTKTTGIYEITRRFDAPRGVIWQAWSEAERLQQWWGPKGCRVTAKRLEFRPGGFFHYAMRFAPDAPPMWGRFLYREIAAPEKLVWLNSFSNEGCGIVRAPFGDLIPLEIENSVAFTDHGDATVVALRAQPHGASAAECKAFEDMFASLEQGYGGTFEQLREYLARA